MMSPRRLGSRQALVSTMVHYLLPLIQKLSFPPPFEGFSGSLATRKSHTIQENLFIEPWIKKCRLNADSQD